MSHIHPLYFLCTSLYSVSLPLLHIHAPLPPTWTGFCPSVWVPDSIELKVSINMLQSNCDWNYFSICRIYHRNIMNRPSICLTCGQLCSISHLIHLETTKNTSLSISKQFWMISYIVLTTWVFIQELSQSNWKNVFFTNSECKSENSQMPILVKHKTKTLL